MDTEPLRSVYTANLPALFDQLGVSLIVSTYQAGKATVVRNDNGALNTHFRTFAKPMGIAADNSRLTIGGANTVWEYRNMPAVAQKLEPVGKHDACYLPRRIHVTGDIDIHELVWDANNELWAVNTRFCCLCTFDADHSFSPRWHPPFVSALAPEDRCHLNGIAVAQDTQRMKPFMGVQQPMICVLDTEDGDGKADIAVYSDEVWSIFRSSDGSNTVVAHGPGWMPGPADFDEDGKTELAV